MAADEFPAGFRDGVRHFNSGRFFEAHEAFEELLDAVESDGRWDLLMALIQVAVGYHKCAGGHPGGARMLGLGAGKLAAFPAVAWGVRVDDLRGRVVEDLAVLEGGGSIDVRPGTRPPRIRLV